MKKIEVIQIFIFVSILFLIFKAWIVSPVLVSGDFWYFFKSMHDNHHFFPYAWYETIGNGLGGPGFAYQNINILFSIPLVLAHVLNLSWETISKFFFFVPYIVISSASSLFLIKRIFPENRFWILAPLVFVLNSFILTLVGGGQMAIALSYAFAPLTIHFFIKVLDFPSLKSLVLTSIILSLQCLFDLRIAFISAIGVIVYFLIYLFLEKKNLSSRKLIYFLSIFVLVLFFNSYWVIPILLFGINPIQQLGVDYSSIGIVKFLSFGKFEQSLSLLHPYWPENIFGKAGFMKPEYLVIPIFAYSSLLFLRKENKKIILFFVVLGLLGAFLGKGSSDPLGAIYDWLFINIPGFQLFRDSIKWYLLTALSYSILIPFSLQMMVKERSKIMYYVMLVSALLFFLFLLKPALLGELSGTFRFKNVPSEYKELESYLTTDKDFYRTLWVPNNQLFGYWSNKNPSVSGRDFFKEYDQSKLLKKFEDPKTQNLLAESSIKYIIVPSDTEKEIYLTDRKYDNARYKEVVGGLEKLQWLSLDKKFGDLLVFKMDKPRDHFWCECDALISYESVNPTLHKVHIKDAKSGDLLVFSEKFDNKWVAYNDVFKANSQPFETQFNSFKIPSGDYSLEIYYSPQNLVNYGVIVSLLALIFSLFILKYKS